jgi:PAP2 superfamily protein
MKTLLALSVLAAAAALAPEAPLGESSNPTLRWNRVVTDALAAAQTDPVTESRALAIVQLAVHDALKASGTAEADAAIATAAHDALLALLPGAQATLDEELARALQPLAEGAGKSHGVELGCRSAAAALAARAHDGSERQVVLRPGTTPGEYRPTPPDLTPAWMAQWGEVTPFVLRSGSQFRPAPPPAVDSALARRDVEQVRLVGGQDSTARTDEQSQIARFWYENSPQGWNRIARTVAEARRLDARESARLLALVNLAMADGFVASFDAKYHYAYWRPATAIRAAGASEWLSYLPTPPIPDYPSAHTVLGAAAATVLARFFENDFVAFETTSGAPHPGLTRSFSSFSEAARENGASRVLCGLHFPTAVRAGYQLGEDVGTWVFEHALPPSDGRSAPVTAAGALR